MTTNLQNKTLIANWVEEVRSHASVEMARVERPTGSMCSLFHCMLEAISSSASAQRQCAHLEEGIRRPDGTLSPALHQQGHRGILSTGEGQETTSTAKDSYTPPQPCSVRTLGQQRVGGWENAVHQTLLCCRQEGGGSQEAGVRGGESASARGTSSSSSPP